MRQNSEYYRCDNVIISIHAPLTGCDDFCDTTKKMMAEFQSTHPLRDATLTYYDIIISVKNFNPRTPYGMRRCASIGCISISVYFNPRTPYGMRQNNEEIKVTLSDISIHAPLTGCDNKRIFSVNYHARFQSTHPLRDATSIASEQ